MCDTLCVVQSHGTLFAKNSDRPAGEAQVAEAFPARAPSGSVRTQYLEIPDAGSVPFVGARPTWLWGLEHGANAHRVAIGNEKLWTVADPRVESPALIGMDLVRLGLERASNADDALDVVTTLLTEHGQGGPAEIDPPKPYFSSFLIADPQRAWVLETCARTWVARPIERGDGAAISNRITLSTDWTRGSPDVAPGSDFDRFRKPDSATLHADRRLAITRDRVAGGDAVTARDLVATLRDHGGSALPPPPGLPRGTDVTLCMHLRGEQATNAAMVAWLPVDPSARSRAWMALGSPCVSVFVPAFPPFAISPELADAATWHAFDRLRIRVEADIDGARGALAEIRAALDPVEDELWEEADSLAARGDDAALRKFTATVWERIGPVLADLLSPGRSARHYRRPRTQGDPMEFNLADLFELVVDTVPEHEALVCGDRRLTYAETDARANRLAHHLEQQGVGAGDKIALYLYNGTEYLEAMLAAFKIRAVPVNVNYRYVEEELRYLLADSDSVAVIFDREFGPKLVAISPELPLLRTFVSVDDGSGADTSPLGALDYEGALGAASPGRDFGPRSADDLYILYTGGTTGMPKGVMWRHEDIFFGAFGGGGIGNEIAKPEELPDRAREGRTRCLPACPFMHGTAHWMAFGALYTGGTVVVSPQHHLEPVALWQLIAREQVNFLVIVGDAFARPLVEALDSPELAGVDLSVCSVILSGGAILSPSVKTALAQKLPGSLVVDGYGSSESGGQGQSVTVAGSEVNQAPRFAVNDETTVLADDYRPAPVGVVGKLARRGRIPVGYYKDPEKSAETFPVVDGVRWSVPGDHARIEDDGTITLLGRGSVSINTGGEKVYPEEVEAALKAHPAVFDAVVVGVPDPRWGERVVALVQPRAGTAPDFADLDAHVRTKVASYKAPRDVILVDEVVRSPSGKPDYRWGKATAIERLASAS